MQHIKYGKRREMHISLKWTNGKKELANLVNFMIWKTKRNNGMDVMIGLDREFVLQLSKLMTMNVGNLDRTLWILVEELDVIQLGLDVSEDKRENVKEVQI